MPNWKKVITSGSDAALNSLNVTNSLTASGLIYPTADNGAESFIQTDGTGNLTLQYVKTIYEEIVNGESTQLVKGTPVYVSGSQGAASIVYRADAGNPAKMPVIYIAADTLEPAEAGRGIVLGLIKGVNTTGYPAGTEIYISVGGGWTDIRPTGSAIVQTLGYVTKEGSGGQGVVLNPGPNSLPNLPSGSVWVGNSDSIPTAVATSSLSVATASFTPNSIVTASVSLNTITFTKGNGTTFPITVDTGSGGGGGAAFPYTGSALITGSLGVTGSVSVTQNITSSRTFISSSNGTVSGSSLTVYGSGSTQPVFTVQGSQGELFSVTDSLSGSLFSVNDISGLPILEVFSDNTTLIGNYLDPMLITTAKVTQTNSGSFTVYSLPTASYDTAFFEYSVKSGSNARAGTIMAIQSGNAVNFTETTTTDFGDTTAVSFTVVVTGSNMALTGSSTTGSWTIKSIVRGL